MMEDTEYLLICDVINVAPVRKLKVKWYQGNKAFYTQTFSGTGANPIDVTASLSVTAGRGYNSALFRCEAELHLGPKGPEFVPTVTSSPYVAHVLCEFSIYLYYYCIFNVNFGLIFLCLIVDKPLIQGCADYYAGVEHMFSLDMLPCQADGNPPSIVQWYYQGKPISASEPLTRSHSGEYTAEAVNDVGTSSISVDITIECECITLA